MSYYLFATFYLYNNSILMEPLHLTDLNCEILASNLNSVSELMEQLKTKWMKIGSGFLFLRWPCFAISVGSRRDQNDTDSLSPLMSSCSFPPFIKHNGTTRHTTKHFPIKSHFHLTDSTLCLERKTNLRFLVLYFSLIYQKLHPLF